MPTALTLVSLLAIAPVQVVGKPSPYGIWTIVEGAAETAPDLRPRLQPTMFRLAALNERELALRLEDVPLESSPQTPHKPTVMDIPLPDGSYGRFAVTESPVMAPELAARYPRIRTFVAQGIDDPTATARLDWTPGGFHAQILSADATTYVDPYAEGNTLLYAVYNKRDYPAPGQARSCSLAPGIGGAPQGGAARSASGASTSLRTYWLACAATGEYTMFHGGTVESGLAAIVTTINRVNGIYERDVGVRMVIIANNDALVFTNPVTDPYTNSNGFAMLDQNQATITSIIGSANYDIGHVFSTGGGGVAGLGVACWNSGKAWGVTGQPAPVGDPFDVDFVSHEIGHQFGASHTFNGVTASCNGNRNGATAYEPGSGSTIMAYAGICGTDDLQPHSDPYFHFASLDEIRAYTVAGFGNTCPSVSEPGNSAPVVSAGVDQAIPRGTPFALTASASDPDGDSLTYGWEEADLGLAATLAAPDNGFIPLFRSFNPTVSATRVFPRLSVLVGAGTSNDEKLPQFGRTMNFRVTARDNRAAGGGVAFDTVRLTVDSGAGPFLVTGPTIGIVPGEMQTVTWDVAGTDEPPVSAMEVSISLSVDGGFTYPFVLAASTPNDGAESVLMPDVVTASARIKIEAVDHVFFAVSPNNLAAGACMQAAPAIVDSVLIRNRFLSISAGAPGTAVAIRVIPADLPAPFDVFDGAVLWVGPPRWVSQHASSINPITGFTNFAAASLQCVPHFTDFAAFGAVEVLHEAVVPSGTYDVQVVMETCDPGHEGSFSAAVGASTARWGDTIGSCGGDTPCAPPDGAVNVSDVLAIIATFSGAPSAMVKARADMEPACPDLLINISDAVFALTGFAGLPYRFAPGSTDPCDSPCTTPSN